MKKTFVVLWALIMIATQAKGEAVTQERAASIAQKLMVSKGKAGKKLSLRKAPAALKSASTSDNPAYYLYAGDSGFVIVAGDDVARPILGYSADGQLPDDGTLPPAMQEWLQDMGKQITTAREMGLIQDEATARMWQAPTTGNIVDQLTTAQWKQGWPFNKECPMDEGKYSATGCVATAYAILMRYFKYPQYGRGTTPAYYTDTKGLYVPARDLNHEYIWDNMPLDYTDYTEAQGDAVAQLMADIGAAIQVDYTKDDTYGFVGNNDVFAYFGLSTGRLTNKDDYELDDWYAMLHSQISAQRPLIYKASDEGSDSGHAFILDGYTDQNYYSVNWGWGGNCNGLFTLDAMNVGNFHFNSGQMALFDCVPCEMLANTVVVNEQEACPTLADAFALVAKDGSHTTIKLTGNTECGYLEIPPYANVTLDLNSRGVELSGKSIFNYGTLNVIDTVYWCPGSIYQTCGNAEVFLNFGKLTIDGGVYKNVSEAQPESYDYRRCIWSAEGSQTTIKNGTFQSPSQVLCFIGGATVDGGEFQTTGNEAVLSVFCYNDAITINGGTFYNYCNYDGDKDYRRALWATSGSNVVINGGKFNSYYQTLCFNGDFTINGGEFYNPSGDVVLFSSNNVQDGIINGGLFGANTSVVSIYNRGNLTINGGDISNEGEGFCLYNMASLTVNGGKMRTQGAGILATYNSASTQFLGGIYSHKIGAELMPSGYQCVDNPDSETNQQYPYMVASTDGIADNLLPNVNLSAPRFYDLGGRQHQRQQSGLNIIRKGGKTVKTMVQ